MSEEILLRDNETLQSWMTLLQHAEQRNERIIAHLAAEHLQVGELRNDVRQHR